MPEKLYSEEVKAFEEESTVVWHMRRDHLSEKGHNILTKQISLSIKGALLKICTHCFVGTQQSFIS